MEGISGEKKHFILVHGAGHGAWCWYKVTTLLRSASHQVTTVDLAAAGIDLRRIDELRTFVEYSQPLFDVISSLPPDEKVILVGHSLGGINIALAMERFPEKIEAAVFLSAFMPDPHSGPSYVLEEYVRRIPREGWLDTKLGFQLGLAKPPTSILFGQQFLSSKLYQLCSPEDRALATALLRVAPFYLEDLSDTSSLSKERYGSVDAIYVVCGQDLAIPEHFQRWLIQNNPVKEVKEIDDADHMPMLSRPQELCQYLLDIVDTCS